MSPHSERARSMTCEPRSPRAPAPDSPIRARHSEVVGRVGGVVLQHPAPEVAGTAEPAGRHELGGPCHRRPDPVVEADLGHAVGGVGGLHHRPGRRPVAGQRLLAHHVLAVGERVDGDLGVEGVRDADVDQVHVVGPGDRPPVDLGPAPPPRLGERAGPLPVHVGDGGQRDGARCLRVRPGHCAVGRAVGSGDLAGADDADADLVGRPHRAHALPMRSSTATLRCRSSSGVPLPATRSCSMVAYPS